MDDYSISGLIGTRVKFVWEYDEVIGTAVGRQGNHMVVVEADGGATYVVSASELEVVVNE